MKHSVIIIGILISTQIFSKTTSAQKEPDLILMKVSQKLNSIKTIKYDLKRELNYTSQDYLAFSKWSIYNDFLVTKKSQLFNFQVEDKNSRYIYNGIENFLIDRSEKTIEIKENPGKADIEGQSFFYNSIITLRNALPLLIDDKKASKTVFDTILNNKTFKVVSINIGKRRIQNFGYEFDTMQTKYDLIYEIMIDPKTYLPVEVLQKNNADKDFIKTNFKNINVSPDEPSENSWYYSSYTSKYNLTKKKEVKNSLKIGSQAPNWSLKKIQTNEEVSLSSLKGKVILIEFWIKNCSYCIKSVPDLNYLKTKLKNENFEILAINPYNSKEEINFFMDKFNVDFSVLYDGKNVAEQYGVSGYPELYIIDKSGKIINTYEGIDEDTILEIEKVIKNAL